jgi:hypothetical protein
MVLIDHIGEPVKNTELPYNTYSKDLKEMRGKVINPLKKVIEKKLGVSLPIKITIQSNGYLLCLSQTPITIGVIAPTI